MDCSNEDESRHRDETLRTRRQITDHVFSCRYTVVLMFILTETRLDAFEMKGLRKILRVSLTAKKTNEWVLGS